VRNLRANPRLMVAVGDPEDDFAVGLIEAGADVDQQRAVVPDAFFAKYADELGPDRLDATTFRALYTQAIRITPTRFLAWRGRGGHAVRVPRAAEETPAQRPRGLAVRLAAALDRIADRLRGAPLESLGAAAA
jgi:hypothetical protein